jgi:para-nitrobenzyl esterase
LAPGNVPGLVATPLDRLMAAIDRVTDRTVRPKRRSFSPVCDGRFLRRDPWLPAAPPYSRDVPVMIGSTRTETSLLIGASDPSSFSIGHEALKTRLLPYYPEGMIDPVLAAIRKTRPEASASELFFLATSDRRVRQQGWVQAEAKLKQGAAVFLYELVWDTPVDSGKWMSPHALDVGLVFNNVAASARTNGGGREAQAVADAMSDAWIAFARTGDPSTSALDWPRYGPGQRSVMLFSPEPHVAPDWRGDERRIMDHLPPMRVER